MSQFLSPVIINIFTVLFIILYAPSGHSKNLDTIAILPFSGQGVDENDLHLVETALRNDINTSNNFKAFEPARMMRLLENNGVTEIRACNEISCAIFMGNILSINFITQCRIGKIEKSYTINLRIIDVKNKEVIKDIAEYFSGSISGLVKKIVPKIARTIIKTRLSNRKFIINGKKEDHVKRDISNQQLQSPEVVINTDNKSRRLHNYKNEDYKYVEKDTDEQNDQHISNIKAMGIQDSVETSGKTIKKMELPRKVDIKREVDTPGIIDTQRKSEAPRIVDTPKKADTPKIVDNPGKVDVPRIVDTPRKVDTPGILNTQKKNDAPRKVGAPVILDTPKRVQAPNTVEILKTEEIPEIIVPDITAMSTDDISNPQGNEIRRVNVNKETDLEIMDQKNRIKLRSIPRGNLKPEEIKKMIWDNDFFCNNSDVSARWSNPDSKYTTNHLVVLSGDKILIDSTTQLMWQSEGSLKRLRYNQINQYVLDINNSYFGGFNNWRLPTLEEAMSIVNSKKNNGLYISENFSSIQNVIWTADKVSVDYSMIVRFDKGQCNYGSTQHYPLYIRLVRSF